MAQSQDDFTLWIDDIPTSTKKDDLEKYLEKESGADVATVKVTYGKDKKVDVAIAAATFQSNEHIGNILKSHPSRQVPVIKYGSKSRGHGLLVKLPKKAKTEFDEITLELIFEDKKSNGGNDVSVKDITLKSLEEAIVTLEDADIYERIMEHHEKKGITYVGKAKYPLDISIIYSHDSLSMHDEMGEKAHSSSEDVVEKEVPESGEDSPGGKQIGSSDNVYDQAQDKINNDGASRAEKKRRLGGRQLDTDTYNAIRQHEPMEEDAPDEDKKENIKNDGRTTVYITGLSGNVDKQLLTLYFNNTRRSGGGPTTDVYFTRSKSRQPWITFTDPHDADRVINNTKLRLGGNSIYASWDEYDVPSDKYLSDNIDLNQSGRSHSQSSDRDSASGSTSAHSGLHKPTSSPPNKVMERGGGYGKGDQQLTTPNTKPPAWETGKKGPAAQTRGKEQKVTGVKDNSPKPDDRQAKSNAKGTTKGAPNTKGSGGKHNITTPSTAAAQSAQKTSAAKTGVVQKGSNQAAAGAQKAKTPSSSSAQKTSPKGRAVSTQPTQTATQASPSANTYLYNKGAMSSNQSGYGAAAKGTSGGIHNQADVHTSNTQYQNYISKEKLHLFDSKSPFSQSYPARFYDTGKNFNSAEQYMMYKKATLFGDYQTANKIMSALTPDEQRKCGRRIAGYTDIYWNTNKLKIVHEGNRLKFNSNPLLKDQLKGTGDKMLAQATKHDTVWGIGLDIDDPRVHNKGQWLGSNLLGDILMQIREELQRVVPYHNYTHV